MFKKTPPIDWLINLNQYRIKQKPDKHPYYGPWYSDDGEDGVINYLFDYIEETSKHAVDIGSAHGRGGSQVRHIVDKYDWGSTEMDGGSWGICTLE